MGYHCRCAQRCNLVSNQRLSTKTSIYTYLFVGQPHRVTQCMYAKMVYPLLKTLLSGIPERHPQDPAKISLFGVKPWRFSGVAQLWIYFLVDEVFFCFTFARLFIFSYFSFRFIVQIILFLFLLKVNSMSSPLLKICTDWDCCESMFDSVISVKHRESIEVNLFQGRRKGTQKASASHTTFFIFFFY